MKNKYHNKQRKTKTTQKGKKILVEKNHVIEKESVNE